MLAPSRRVDEHLQAIQDKPNSSNSHYIAGHTDKVRRACCLLCSHSLELQEVHLLVIFFLLVGTGVVIYYMRKGQAPKQ